MRMAERSTVDPRLIAFYLPQYHPIPENDRWWGAGFTEWTNVAEARPLFPGHEQPHIPADLGFYDLRSGDVREAQARLAREYGVSGFCYYHYWFDGRRVLGGPLDDVLATGRPDFPFCLCWANENWTRVWDGGSGDVLIRQNYSEEDDRQHIRWLATAFRDRRYIRIDDRPLLLVYRASLLPDPTRTMTIWREEARRLDVGEPFLCRVESFPDERGDPAALGFDAAVEFQPDWVNLGRPLRHNRGWAALRKVGLTNREYGKHRIHEYGDVVKRMLRRPPPPYRRYPCVTPSWDNTPRRKEHGVILHNSTPELYERWLRETIETLPSETAGEPLVFINAWNEWGEGAHLEPSRRWGRRHLEATRSALIAARSGAITTSAAAAPEGTVAEGALSG
jgi:lipopolysaccharide biosynthesis protein